jgi:hypothetical protein
LYVPFLPERPLCRVSFNPKSPFPFYRFPGWREGCEAAEPAGLASGNTQYELLFITDGSTAYWKIKNIS